MKKSKYFQKCDLCKCKIVTKIAFFERKKLCQRCFNKLRSIKNYGSYSKKGRGTKTIDAFYNLYLNNCRKNSKKQYKNKPLKMPNFMLSEKSPYIVALTGLNLNKKNYSIPIIPPTTAKQNTRIKQV